jgi:hypothetical protein
MKVSPDKLNRFIIAGKHYASVTPLSKLRIAVEKILQPSIKKLKKVEEKKNELRREYALKLEKGVFNLDANGNLKYDEQGLKNLNEKLSEFDDNPDNEVEITPHIIAEGDYDEAQLSYDMRTAFMGLVIADIDYDNIDWDKLPGKK